MADIQNACAAVQRHAGDLTPQQYESDVLVRSLVERQCEIIGEALRRIERLDTTTFQRIEHARRIIDFRNVISHGYDIVDPVIVSQIVREHLPRLMRDVQAIMATLKQ